MFIFFSLFFAQIETRSEIHKLAVSSGWYFWFFFSFFGPTNFVRLAKRNGFAVGLNKFNVPAMKSSDSNFNAEATSKIMNDQNIPIEELLGSVTTYNNVEGSDSKSLQLRTSARVFKKMKLDSSVAPVVVTFDKKEPVKGEANKPEVKKPFRPLWSQEDKNLFFEALNEYGKDFEAIHSHISGKLKKKGLPESMIKTKDQVRHLYYRTWHKISKHLRFSDDVKKAAQELYALINYGELRKKLSFISEKTCVKLNELIYRGSVAIRVKGKTVRIRTPMCKALRKLNQLDEKHDDIKLPNRVTVELQPKDMNTWMHVQSMSQNPRVKATLPLQKRLSSLISYMEERWKTRCAIDYSTFNSTAAVDNKEDKSLLESPLRLCPPGTCNLEMPAVNLSEFLTSQSICLNAYEERIGAKIAGEQLWLNSYPNSSKGNARKSGMKRVRNESSSEKLSPNNLNKALLSVTDNNENCLNDNDLPHTVDEVVDEVVNTILALQQQQDGNSSSDEKPCEMLDGIKTETDDDGCDIKKEHDDVWKFQNGWTVYDCGTLAVGDLYLMFGADAKITLEYSWDDVKLAKMTPECVTSGEKATDVEIGNDSQNELEVSENSVSLNSCSKAVDDRSERSDNLSCMLKRLLSVAKLHYRKNRICCPCGHVCGGSPPAKISATRNKSLKFCTREKFFDGQDKSILRGQQNEAHSASLHPYILEPFTRKLSPSALFRRPSSPNDILRAQLDSIQRLKPRYCNRKGRRPRAKQLVVERKLPILANKPENGRQIVQMNIISQDNIPTTPRPIAPKIVMHSDANNKPDGPNMSDKCNLNGVVNLPTTATPISTVAMGDVVEDYDPPNVTQTISISDNATTTSQIGSPTSISNLIEMALTPHDGKDVALSDVQGSTIKDGCVTSFEGFLSQNIQSGTSPSSPSRILKENENQWLTSEVADFSLSSFLGHLDSPLKHSHSTSSVVGEDSRLCLTQDVDAHLQSLLTETSLDYTAKFADLAAQVTDIKKD